MAAKTRKTSKPAAPTTADYAAILELLGITPEICPCCGRLTVVPDLASALDGEVDDDGDPVIVCAACMANMEDEASRDDQE